MKMIIHALLALSGLSPIVFGAVKWETTQVEQAAAVAAESVDAAFRFTNTGQEPVTFKSIKSSCGCTTAAMEKMTYAPGESGAINAQLTIGTREGLQTKHITVTIEGEPAPTVLTMQTIIPKLLEMKPTFVFWQQGDTADVKTINLLVGAEAMHITTATSDNDQIKVELETVEAGKRYKLKLSPTQTAAPLKARITLTTDYPQDKPKTFDVYAHVK